MNSPDPTSADRLSESIAAIARAAVAPLLNDLAERTGTLEIVVARDVLHETAVGPSESSGEWRARVSGPEPRAATPKVGKPEAVSGALTEADLWSVSALTLMDEANRGAKTGPTAAARGRREKQAARVLLDAVAVLGRAEAMSPGVVGRLAAAHAARGGA
ncbi:hypothetical protein [Limnoglobus roseus]|uniref:Uncharacterized protein n=1 Tax=Limnoglobus roseus TaxID=2598579 RepID=A0A5C1AUF6_9BACT|nr:hypothetical protein [Limnoglobus roseus]QEL20408.1 hypothetical protein PX52LOC_07502 [Limnoglobus roseus]